MAELAKLYKGKGLSPKTADLVAKELTAVDPVRAHLDAELNIDEEEIANPMHAAVASLLSFTAGALIPLLSAVFAPHEWRIQVTLVAVTLALILTGYYSATVGGASRRRAVTRVVVGGVAAMIITYFIGHLFGVAVG